LIFVFVLRCSAKQELYCQEIVNECVSSYFEKGYQNAMKKPH